MSAMEIAEAAIARADRVQAELNCFMEIDAEGMRAAALRVDRKRSSGRKLGPLAGVPVAIKDCTPVKGLGNRFGSHAFAHNVASEDAAVVERFRQADALILGKTTLSEFASSSFCDSPLHGITRNPWNVERTPGGSSGGSAVAVATGCVAVAQGTDMGGSVRIPASCTGIVGIKPAAGRIPLDDQPSFVDDIQHHGVLVRTVADLVASLPPICGKTLLDPTTYVPDLPTLSARADVSDLRIAVTDDLGFFEIEPEVKARLAQAAEALEHSGARVSRPALDWDRAIADGWVRHWHVYLAAFFGDDLDRIGPLADPRLVHVIRKGREADAVSMKRLDLLRRRQWKALAGIFHDHEVLTQSNYDAPSRRS
jgi:Asp-tRNA(Asn)/Glu-tRNA(Gln) amidotransferase A subunit family amidase